MDVAGHRILLFGDSLSAGAATPGTRALDWLTRAGAAATRVDARVGRSAHNFYAREDHAALLRADVAWRPTIVVVWLGTNDIGLNLEVDEARLAAIRDTFAGARVVALTPPLFPAVPRLRDGRDDVVAMIRRTFPEVIDVGPLTPVQGRSSDGIHFTAAGAELLSVQIARALLALEDPPQPGRWRAPVCIGALTVAGALAWLVARRELLRQRATSSPRSRSSSPARPSPSPA